MFKRNEGIIDRSVRVLLGIVLMTAGLFLMGGLQGSIPGLVAAGFSLLPLTTGLTGFCPLYVPFGFSTLEKEKQLMAGFQSMMAACRSGIQNAGNMCGLDPKSLDHTGDPGSQTVRTRHLQA